MFEFPAILLDKIAEFLFPNYDHMQTENIHSNVGFAKGRRVPSKRDAVNFGDFLTSFPTAPLVDTAPTFTYPMDGNDSVGDCVVAGFDHFRQIVTGLLTGTPMNFTQDQIWAFYKTQNPDFDPNGTASTNGPQSSADNGMDIQTFLEYLQANNYIVGFARIDYTNDREMQAAIYLGLGIITGVVLDQAQMTQFESGVWDNVPGSPVDGGHCIPLGGYASSEYTCVSWAKLVQCTKAFINNQMDEAWFVLTQDHINHPNFRNSFNLAGFSQAVSEITGGKIVIPVPEPALSQKQMTKDSFLSFYQNTVYYNTAGACFDAVSVALTDLGIMSPLVLIGALATVRTEVGRMYMPVREEITQAMANTNYDGILGNVPGSNDGYTYRGGGLIQLTGRDNYAKFGTEIGVDLVNNPDFTTNLPVSAKILAQFFKDNKIDEACNASDWTTVRQLVNGGTNGLGTFLSIIGQFLSVMN